MKTAWVTGAGGFIGSHMVDFLLDKKWNVIATVKPGKSKIKLVHLLDNPPENLTLLDLDIRDAKGVEDIIVRYRPDAIFHFAAQSTVKPSWEDPAYTIETNVIGEINIFEAVKKHGIGTKIIVACSSAEYGEQSPEELPLKETNHLRPVHPYGVSKVAQELMARQYWLNFKIPCVILRFFNQTGPRKDNDACSEFARKIAKIVSGKAPPIIEVGNLETQRDITGIKDTLNAIWLAYEKGVPGETYNVCSGRPTKIRDVLNYLISLSGMDIEVRENTPSLLRITDEPIILGDNSKISALGFSISQSIGDLLQSIYNYWLDYYRKYDE